MKLIIGLGNPGKKYEKTRHNVGKLAVEHLAKLQDVKLKDKSGFKIAEFEWADQNVCLAELSSFMNVSGPEVLALMKKVDVEHFSNLLVIMDDLHIPLGRLRFRPKGSSGGHNGLKSISDALGSESFARLRIGIGKPESGETDWKDYVLDVFVKDEVKILNSMLEKATRCALSWVHESSEAVMQRFNG